MQMKIRVMSLGFGTKKMEMEEHNIGMKMEEI